MVSLASLITSLAALTGLVILIVVYHSKPYTADSSTDTSHNSAMAQISWFTIRPGERITIDPNTMTKRATSVTWSTTLAEPEKTTAATCTSTLYSEPIPTHGPTSTEWASTKTATQLVDCSGCDLAILYGGHIFYVSAVYVRRLLGFTDWCHRRYHTPQRSQLTTIPLFEQRLACPARPGTKLNEGLGEQWYVTWPNCQE